VDQRLSLFTLGVTDLAEARKFYEALGWTTGAEEVDDVIEEARAAGATIGREPGETFWGGYSGVFIDPAGHPWEVAHNPRWTVGDDGSVTLPD
jgi:uncharacterized protein